MEITRRSFFKKMGAFAALAVVTPKALVKLEPLRRAKKLKTAIITKGNHPRDLWPGAQKWFNQQYDEVPRLWK